MTLPSIANERVSFVASSNDTPTKRCSKCGVEKARTREYFPPRPANTDGLDNRCKSCESKRRKQERSDHPERHKAAQKRYRQKNREWWINRIREWRETNRDHIAQYRKRYYTENAERCRKTSRRIYRANRARYAASNRTWRLNNPERYKEKQHRRRARVTGAGGSYTRQDIQLQMKAQGGNCWWCGKPMKGEYQIDHRIPISRGGSNYPENIVLAHSWCNQSKKDKTPAEYMGRLF